MTKLSLQQVRIFDMKQGYDSDLQKQAWDYFVLHASQRMTVFNFYIILSALITTSYVASFNNHSNLAFFRIALAALLSLFAFVFWKLDERTKRLVKIGEEALKYFEGTISSDEVAKVFTREEIETSRKRAVQARWNPRERLLSYSDCFQIIFGAFFLAGVVELIISIAQCFKHAHT